MFLSSNTPLVAVDIGSYSIKVAQLNQDKSGQFELAHFAVMPLEEESVVVGVVKKPDEVAETLAKLLKTEKIQTRFAISSVAGEAVIVKKIKVPVRSKEELEETIEQEAEQYIPFDIDEVKIDFQIMESAPKKAMAATGPQGESVKMDISGDQKMEMDEEDGEKMEILLVAVQRRLIDSRMDVLTDIGLKPVIIDLDTFALVNAVNLSTDISAMGAVALMDMGDSFTHLIILTKKRPALTRDIPMGGGYCSRRLMKNLEIPYVQATHLKAGEIPSGIEKEVVIEAIIHSHERILEEVKKSFEFFSTTSNTHVEKLFISGGGALIAGTDEYFAEHLQVPVEVLDPMKHINFNPKLFDRDIIEAMSPMSAVAIGLATRRFDYV